MLNRRERVIVQGGWWILAVVRVVSAGVACLSDPCLHGICLDDVNSTLYSCYCVDGYTGVQCQTNWDECWSDPCQNGGSCIDGIASYNCSCPEGFIGENCETNFNECESNPCLNNGTCIDMTNGYMCSCVPGFSGEHCELDIAVCNASEEIRCHNGGQCVEGPGLKFYCKCMQGWTGQKCETQIDECESNPCQNGGVCIDVHADYLCACTYGYTGKSCEVAIEFCDENSCRNDALCVMEEGVAVCYCVPDYHGDKCEMQYNECLIGPGCMNGGTCIDGIDNFTCSCPPRLTGSLCECLILSNDTQDCEYVSPTPLPFTTQSVFLSSVYEAVSTTEEQSTKLTDSYNETISTVTGSTNLDIWKSTTISFASTTIDATESATTAAESPATATIINSDIDLDTSETITTIPEESTTITSEIGTEATQINSTLKIEDSKAETSTECKESCDQNSESTLPAKSDLTTSTALQYEPTIVTTETGITTTLDTLESVSRTTDKEAEEPTTIKIDTTTDKLFTDSPTDQTATDTSTATILTTTTGTDATTIGGDTTISIFTSTVQTKCTDDYCNNQGSCIRTSQGIQCRCNFNYDGNNCENKMLLKSAAFNGKSYIAHKLRNTTSIDIEFKAKTLISDGQIMHVDIADGVYMQLCMGSGLLKFKFSCGYQTMLLSELKTFVNKGYLMKIETRLDLFPEEQHCNATLRLNDTVAMSGGQVANITALNHITTLYLGNRPNILEDNKPFIGCIRDLMVNGEGRNVFADAFEVSEVSECSSLACLSGPCRNGGTCIDHGDNYTCACANGWMGLECEQSVCEHNPCASGGRCVPHPASGFLCLCPYGKHGIFCEYNLEITRPSLSPISTGISSYVVYALSQSMARSDRFDLRLRFHTTDMDQIALLAFVGQTGRHDSKTPHLAVTFVKGYIMLTWNMGNGARRIFTSRAVGGAAERRGHVVRAWRRGRAAGLSVDGRHNISGHAPAQADTMPLAPYLYIGGHPSAGFLDLPHDLPLHSGWRGCVWDVAAGSGGAGGVAGGRGAGQCGVAQCSPRSCNSPRGLCIHSPATYGCICNDGWFGATCDAVFNPCDKSRTRCQGSCVITSSDAQCDCPYGKTGEYCDQDLIPTDVLFTGKRSYIRLNPSSVSTVSLAFEAEIKPSKERGLIIFARTPHFYTALSLQGGLLEYRWTDVVSGVTSLVRSGLVVSMDSWHSVKAGRYGSRLYLWLDGATSTEHMLSHTMPHTATHTPIYVGGIEDLSTLPFDAISGPAQSFSGCIRNFHLNNVLIPLEPQNIEGGRNVLDCDGTACGAELCGGAACSLAAGGARCRRQLPAPCARTCRAPHARCRRGRCVCGAGYTGPHCLTSVNVTIPQFSGESLLSLARKTSWDRHRSEQKLGTAVPRPDYVSFNFTTAEPDGLLFWISMDLDFLGMGLENGNLKLVWSIQYQNTSDYDIDNVSKLPDPSIMRTMLIPDAGYLSDAEWHTLVLRVGAENVTVVVDETLAYNREPGISNHDYYNVDVYFGGTNEEDSAIAKKVFPRNFKGCIDHISTNEESTITNFNDLYSENIKSCQLFP